MSRRVTKKYVDELTYEVIGGAIEVNKALGPGLLESIYHECMNREMEIRHLPYRSELPVDVMYKGNRLSSGLRCDMLVDDLLVVEMKAVSGLQAIHEAQTLTYMKLLQKPKGLLLNFTSTNIFRRGQKTFVNEYFRALPDS